ncbi:hypothetical protein [Arcobacter sp. F2176]|uniref:hypothetical protein n=1 Tax=Arcobacter sp. F2176 TaxID=2044511 RepID=UPI00100B9BF8|nr:hypothetical protein [Arcobacter sp. F2176]RXJ82357.1 hypothetical protein CRU95_02550 [Arcobacter sp. F2176]
MNIFKKEEKSKIILQEYWEQFSKSLIEFVMNILISTVPITIGALFIIFDNNHSLTFQTYCTTILAVIKNGELYLYSATLLAPVVFLTTYDKDGKKSFPLKWFFIPIVLFLFIIISHFFGEQRAINLPEEGSIFTASVYIFILTVILYFLVLLISNKKIKPASDIMKESEIDFEKQYEERRKRNG